MVDIYHALFYNAFLALTIYKLEEKVATVMRIITKSILALTLAVTVLAMTGCESTTHSSEQQAKKYGRIFDVNRKMAVDDFDKFFMLDRNSRLSRWHTITAE